MREMKNEMFHSRLFGYNRPDVDHDVSELALQNQNDLNWAENEISNYRIRNEKLKKQIKQMNDLLENLSIPLHLLEYSADKSEILMRLYENYLDQRIADFRMMSDQTEQLYANQVAVIKAEMNINQLTLERALNIIMQKNDDLNQNIEEFSSMAPSGIRLTGSASALEMKELFEFAKTKDVSMPENLLLTDVIPDVSADMHEAAITPEYNPHAETFSSVEANTADGNPIKNPINLNNFWGDFSEIDEFECDTLDASDVHKTKFEQGYPSDTNVEHGYQDGKQEEFGRRLNPAGKYIIGKIAGEDLYDAEGNLIIRKDETITEQIVIEAEKADKLSELIIDMTIPDVPIFSAVK